MARDPWSVIANAGAAVDVVDGVPVAGVVAGGAGSVVAVAVVALPTLHREIRRRCYQSGEDTYYTRGTRDIQNAAQRRWEHPTG